MQNEIGRLRREFQEERAKLFPPEARFAPCLELLRRHVELIDRLVGEIYAASCSFADRQARRTGHSALAIVATGGYGRRELNPFSDIDIGFVPSEEEDPWVEAVVHMAFKLVMDVFLSFREVRVGYSYRPISEVCTWDLPTKTALLDARHLCGDPSLSEQLKSAVRAALFPLDLILEQQAEERRPGRDLLLYSVEPHLKQGSGSLRDLHRARWIFKLLLSVEDAELLSLLCQKGYLSTQRAEEIRAAAEWFWSARNWTHLSAGKRSDVLIVDYQDRIARELGPCSAQEWLSRHFAHAEVLALFLELAVRRVLSGPLDLDGIRLQAGYLKRTSASAVKLTLLSQRYSIPLSGEDASDLAERRTEAARVERPSPDEALAFTAILNEKRSIAGTLGFMGRMGLLDRFVPDFSGLMRLVPPDAIHSYTVGSHSLRVIERLERLRAGGDPAEQRFGELISQCSHFDMLCLAALLHDTGKAIRSGDHSDSATASVNAVAERLNLPAEKRQILEILVRQHLLLVRTARLQDLKSPAVIQAVAERCTSVEILRHLYVFTYVDTRGVTEKSWTSLDYRDLEELYAKVQDSLSGKSQEEPESAVVEDRIGQIRRKLAAPNGPHEEEEVLRHCDAMPGSYVLNTSLDEIALHLQLLERLTSDKVVLDIYNRPGDDYSELTVCAYDDPQPGLLAKITGVLFGCNADIQRAQVYTLSAERPVVLDMLWVRAMGMQLSENRAARIRTALSEVLAGTRTIEQFLRGMGKQAPSRVALDSLDLRNDLSEEHTVVHVVAPDAQGLLYSMTRALSRCGLHIHMAKVATWNTHAENNFYVTALTGGQIPDKDLALWKQNLARQLAGESSQ
jgi:[protein-PII] uridylyltransferase